MHIRIRRSAAATALALSAVLPATSTVAVAAEAPTATETAGGVGVEYFPDPAGEGARTRVPADSPHTQPPTNPRQRTAAQDGEVVPIAETGPTADRLDVTIIGDGYTAAQQEDFLQDARAKWDAVTDIEPYKSYEGLFNVWAVQAVSQDSGVTGDPTQDVTRNTALGSYFFCDEIERLICVDLDKTKSYADKAPATDLVIVVSNSTKYGGAGYSGLAGDYGYDGVSTLSSDNAQSTLIAAHEMAHSIGLLADEYQYDGYGAYPGDEPAAANVSKLTADRMAAQGAKWADWLGETDPSGGVVDTFEGGDYYEYGIYRPTANSIMRSLATDQFNLPGREAMIAGFYRSANALTPLRNTVTKATRFTRLSVELADLGPGTGLSRPQLRWYVDGREAKQARGRTSVVPAALGVPSGRRAHTVTATMVDATPAVRDRVVRKLTSNSVTWTVVR
ncbi:M64 family metallopeptidase [Streptomyces sp. Tu 4128]|uniref:M64 family metallopeptidase n=1 Tax=Streptomyces sp. Tu 4128 TaxID=1120314 RepID=UPI000F02A9DC|nr:M64 family metallopeptidase [Streptomyces sp. Tu 4128]